MALSSVLENIRRTAGPLPPQEWSAGRQRNRYQPAVLFGMWAIAVAYLAVMIDRQWVPHDEGLLGQTAERVLRGEAPHRDFGDMYTGGQAYFHAIAFEIGGVSLLVLRYALLLIAAAWVPVLFSIASRTASRFAAIPLTALAIIWSVPNYPAAVPSWYNLFLATFGFAAILRFIDTGRRLWIVTAGLAGGVSFLFKITAIFYVAAVLLFLLVRAARQQQVSPAHHDPQRRWLLVGWVILTVFVLALVKLITPVASVEHVFHFVLPGAALALVAAIELRRAGGLCSSRMASLSGELLLFLGGLAVPVAFYAAPHAVTGDLGRLGEAWFLAPRTRYDNAALPPFGWPGAVPAVLVMLSAAAFALGQKRAAFVAIGMLTGIPALLWLITGQTWFYEILWLGLAQSTPLVVLTGAALLLLRPRSISPKPSDFDRLYLILSLAGLCSLIQLPFAAPIYFCYTAPLTLLALGALWRAAGAKASVGLGSLALGYCVFGLVALNGQGLDELGLAAPVPDRLVRLSHPRGRLLVPVGEAQVYSAVVDSLRRYARGGYTFAAPDAPEVYYLSGLGNPTRVLFEFTEQHKYTPESTLQLLEQHTISAIAINRHPKYSSALSPEVEAVLARVYPDSALIGKFLLRWAR